MTILWSFSYNSFVKFLSNVTLCCAILKADIKYSYAGISLKYKSLPSTNQKTEFVGIIDV